MIDWSNTMEAIWVHIVKLLDIIVKDLMDHKWY